MTGIRDGSYDAKICGVSLEDTPSKIYNLGGTCQDENGE